MKSEIRVQILDKAVCIHFMLMFWGKAGILQLSHQLWVNSRTDWVFQKKEAILC